MLRAGKLVWDICRRSTQAPANRPAALRQKFCYPRRGVKRAELIRCARSDCYRGGNGSKHESDDTERGLEEVAAALSQRRSGTQTKAAGPGPGAPGLSSQGGDPILTRTDDRAKSADYYRSAHELRTQAAAAVFAT